MKKNNLLYFIILGGMIILTLSAGLVKPLEIISTNVKAIDNISKTADKLDRETNDGQIKAQKNGIETKSTKDEAFGQEEVPEYPSYYAVTEQYLYYLSPFDFKIYRVEKDGSGRKLVTKDIANYNGLILHGDWIYFINLSKGETLYRVSKDGSKSEKVMEGKAPINYEPFFKYKDNLYYYDESNELHCLNMEGNEVTMSEKLKNILSNISLGSRIYNNYIYNGSGEGIYKTSLIDGERTGLTNEPVYDYRIYNGLIYYINYDDHRLYSMDLNGENTTLIIDEEVMREGPDYDTGRFYVDGKKTYYIKYQEEGEGTLFRSGLDGSGKEIIAQKAEDFMFDGTNIYYIDGYDNAGLYKIDISTGVKSQLTKGDFTFCLEPIKDFVFFGMKSTEAHEAFDGRLFAMDRSGKVQIELK